MEMTYQLKQTLFGNPVACQCELYLATRLSIDADLLLHSVEVFVSIEPLGIYWAEQAGDLRVVHGKVMIWQEMDAQLEHARAAAS